MNKEKIIIDEVVNSGFRHEDPRETDYHSEMFLTSDKPLLGAISPLQGPPVIFDDGFGWKQVALSYGNPEIQRNTKFDTYSCVVFSIAKALCYYIFKQYGIKITISEMYNAFWAEVKHGRGTTIRKGMESFRKKGWISDSEYPFTKDMLLTDFFKAPPKSIQVKAEGKLLEWDFHWEVLPDNIEAIFEQYKKTPVVLTGFAWARSSRNPNVYIDYGKSANHAFLGLEPINDGDNLCDDTYPKSFKYKESIKKDELFKVLDKSFTYWSAHYCWVTPTKKKKEITIKKILNMFSKISRSVKGGFWFIKKKDGVEHKQKIDNWESMLGAIIDEVGVNKNNLTEDELKAIPDFKFFGK